MVYPNPATEHLHVDLALRTKENGQATVELRNMIGEVVYAEKIGISGYHAETDISISKAIAAGVYFVIARIDDQVMRSEVVISR